MKDCSYSLARTPEHFLFLHYWLKLGYPTKKRYHEENLHLDNI